MAALAPLPPLPPQFKSIQHHLRTAQEHDKRDAVVAYYCRLYAMQTGMKIDSKTPECRKFLSKLMDQLEALKKQLGDNEAITQEIVGSAHLENYALKMFLYADNEDRAGRFHKNMIKSFYTASLLIDVITVFGELTDEYAVNLPEFAPLSAFTVLLSASPLKAPLRDIRLTPEDFARAQKYCKYAGSALQYEDVSTAVQNLQKALKLLTTGRE
ncbi:vacuolar protein sorting-associated protein VTA1 homolog [Orycteropus afer afer]|uniref:Vacuolar protein sorting-associated protein VTA1 homolog n=1 Tax=Orycteropus afer afer TaxID=1230840 RepID=A0A8B7AG77_ORYAF|nr:vacuolar protein sorting-associated protein VTA1 homolog [Orycteropus afer afer]